MKEPDMQRTFEGGNRHYTVRRHGEPVGGFAVTVPAHTRRAWRIALQPKTNDQSATLVQWLVHCPYLHTMWTYWWITLIHLRDIPGAEPAKRTFPQAEYELSIYAQGPERDPDPETCEGQRFLHPVDVVEQFHGVTDEQAVALVEVLVRSVVDGLLSPDSDYRAEWNAHVSLCVQHATTGHAKVDA